MFVVIFMAYIYLVYSDVGRGFNESRDFVCIDDTGMLSSRDTLKVVRDTTFSMSMSTNNPFRGSKKFVMNLTAYPDTSYCYPLLHSKVISEYGYRDGRSHSGVDIKTFPNDKIHAAFDGRVVMSSFYYGYGNCIILRHRNGLETLYSHNSKNMVKVGDDVRAGQVIALTGRTGRATTEHLHFECRIKGCHFNPNKLFNHATEELRNGYLYFTNKGGGVSTELVEVEKKKGL